mgnify:CR=1 FL=1
MRDELRTTIFTLVLGANVTTSASSGGSYALANVQQNSTESLVTYDRQTLEETLTDDLLGCLWFYNHANLCELGIASQPPRFEISQHQRQDPRERAQVAQQLFAMGVPLSMQDVLDQTGFKRPEDGEETITKPEQLPGLGGFPGLGGLPTPNTDPSANADDGNQPQTFQQKDSYQVPESAQNNAKKVLRWKDEHGDDVKGMTSVGWNRARQLASGKPISGETVRKMAGFNRHRKNSKVAPEYKDTPWRDAGYVAWLGWGGTTGIDWARGLSANMQSDPSTELSSFQDRPRYPKGHPRGGQWMPSN